MMLEPMDWMAPVTLSLRPRTTEEMPMTTATPITTPRMVSPERSLFLRMVSQAMRTITP